MCRAEEERDVTRPKLHVEILRGRNFERKGQHVPCNTSCLLRIFEERNGNIADQDFKSQMFRTKVQQQTSNPVWNESFTFELASVEHGRLEISFWDSCFSAAGLGQGQAAWIGQIVINTSALLKASGEPQELDLRVRQEKESACTHETPNLSVRMRLDVGVSSPRLPKQVEIHAQEDPFSFEKCTFCDMAQEMHIFRNIDRNTVLALCAKMQPTKFPPNEMVFAAGTIGKSMYFVLTGECVVIIGGKAVVKLHAGDHFGEVALLVSQKRTADVYTTQPSLLMEITQEDLHEVLQSHVSSANALYATLKTVSDLRVRRNAGGLEQHPSVMNGAQESMLSGKCSAKDRLARVNAWHHVYSQEEGSTAVPTTDECMEEGVDEDEVKMLEEAKWWSGVDDKVIAVIKSIKLFQDMPARALAQVVSKLRVQFFHQGETIIAEGTEGHSMYIIDEGAADVMVKNAKVSEMSTHSIFGEVALVNSQIRTATVVATKSCRCLRLEQNDLWTVFNMFPSLYKTLAEIADARIHNASFSDLPDTNGTAGDQPGTARGKGKFKRRGSITEQWNVKFRAPLKTSTAEQAGVCPSHCLYLNVQKAQAFFPGDKADRTTLTLSDSSKVLHRSGEAKGLKPMWTDMEQQHKFPYDHAAKLHFAVHRVTGGWTKKEHPTMTGVMDVVGASQHQQQNQQQQEEHAMSTVVEISDAQSASRKANPAAAECKGTLRVDFKISRPYIQPYVLWVPLQKMRVTPWGAQPGFPAAGGVPALGHSSVTSVTASEAGPESTGSARSSPSAPNMQAILDRSGKSVMWARWRLVPEEESGDWEDGSLHNKYVTVIDLANSDGSYGGQIVTDVTKGSHARSRLLTSFDVHWATVKTKMVLPHKQHKPAQKQKGSPMRASSESSRPDATYRSSFKVVPIYSEFEIRSSGPPASAHSSLVKSHSASHSSLVKSHSSSSASHAHEGATSRSVVLTRSKKDGQRTTVGCCKISHNTEQSTHLRVDVQPQQDMLLLLQLALAIGESQLHAPVPEPQAFPDSFQNVYQTT